MIQILDVFFLANVEKTKCNLKRVAESDFYNDALNKDVDLRKQAEIYYKEWNDAKRNNRKFDRFSFFTLYCYPWTLNAYRKSELFRIMQSQDRHDHIGQALLNNLGSLFNPN